VLGVFIFLGASKEKFSSAVVLAEFIAPVLKLDLLLWTSLHSRCLLAFRVLGFTMATWLYFGCNHSTCLKCNDLISCTASIQTGTETLQTSNIIAKKEKPYG
jgi:hypothetical protein